MKENELICPICGEPTNSYMGNYRKDRLCRKHAKELKDGLIEQCEDCGEWHEAGKCCICKIKTAKIDFEKAINDNTARDTNELACIICGEPSNGKHFCKSCYYKYKERSVDIRITNCNSVQILDEFGSKTKKAKDGRYVRSLSEKIIIDYFFDNYIRVVYEKTIPYVNDKGEDKALHPDFFLTDYNLYIEFNGLTNKEYLKKKEYANRIYHDKGLNVEILESDDINDIDATMGRLLAKYKKS